MKNVIKAPALAVVAAAILLAGCQSSASRIAECQAEGISRDTCYLSEQNRKQGINAVAQKQAMENAANAVQHAQAAKKLQPIHVKKFGVDFRRSRDGFAYIDDHAAAHDESNEYADVYSSGLYIVTVYTNGRITLLKNGQLVGRMK